MLLKSCADQLAKPLSLIYQASYDEGQLPSDWKLANVSSIFKKGTKNDPGNYTLVSLVTEFCCAKQWKGYWTTWMLITSSVSGNTDLCEDSLVSQICWKHLRNGRRA